METVAPTFPERLSSSPLRLRCPMGLQLMFACGGRYEGPCGFSFPVGSPFPPTAPGALQVTSCPSRLCHRCPTTRARGCASAPCLSRAAVRVPLRSHRADPGPRLRAEAGTALLRLFLCLWLRPFAGLAVSVRVFRRSLARELRARRVHRRVASVGPGNPSGRPVPARDVHTATRSCPSVLSGTLDGHLLTSLAHVTLKVAPQVIRSLYGYCT